MKEYQLYLFDLDGLLLNSEEIYLEGWIIALKRMGLEVDEELLQSFSGMSAHHSKDLFIARYKEPILYDQVYQMREKYIYECLANGKLHLLPFARESLVYLHQKGKRCGLVSGSWRKRIEAYLDWFDLAPYFEFYIGNEDVRKGKPDPEGYLQALERAGVLPEKAIAFEDSNTGCLAAQQAGIYVVQIPSAALDHFEGNQIAKNLAVIQEE